MVAVHTGGWGYREMVLGKGSTQQLASSPIPDVVAILSGILGPWGIGVGGVYAYLVHWRAVDAVNNGQCFAWVRPFWGSPYFPAKESWGCW